MWLNWTSFPQSIRCYEKLNAYCLRNYTAFTAKVKIGEWIALRKRHLSCISHITNSFFLLFIFAFCFETLFGLSFICILTIRILFHALHKRIEYRALKQVCFALLEPLCHCYQIWVALDNAIECGRNNCTAVWIHKQWHIEQNFLQNLLTNNIQHVNISFPFHQFSTSFHTFVWHPQNTTSNSFRIYLYRNEN